MSSIVSFNGNQYDLAKIRVQAATGNDIELKRNELVIGPMDFNHEADIHPPTFTIDEKEPIDNSARVAVFQYNGKYYVMSGRDRILEKFRDSKTGIVKVKLLSKHMLKKCVLGYQGAKIVADIPEPPRRYGSTRDYQNDYSRGKYNRDR